MTPYERQRNETESRYTMRKTLDAAENRMRTRTARQQLAEALRLSRGPEEIPLPDADDSSIYGVLR